MYIYLPLLYTVYPKKYAHGFNFAVLCCGYTLTDFPISIRLTSLALWQSNDCPSASKATLMNMDKYFMWIHYKRLHNHNKAKHNKTACIFLGIYCINIYMHISRNKIQKSWQSIIQALRFPPTVHVRILYICIWDGFSGELYLYELCEDNHGDSSGRKRSTETLISVWESVVVWKLVDESMEPNMSMVEVHLSLIKLQIMDWNYIYSFQWDAITHSCSYTTVV